MFPWDVEGFQPYMRTLGIGTAPTLWRNAMRIVTSVIAAALVASTATTAYAHPKLLTASPAANATVAAPKAVQLRFSEKLVVRFSTADLVMTGMPGMADHAPMKMSGIKTSVAGDGRTLVLSSARPLSAGTYRVDYRVVSGDTHPIKGSYSFRVS